MILQYYNDYRDLGLTVIPIEWDVTAKAPKSHRLWSTAQSLKLLPKHNALMIKTDSDIGCLDFDIKNTENKGIFIEWRNLILSQQPGIYDKLYIEKTKSDGYHVWLKYPKLLHKVALADSESGHEVIALYAKGPAVYTYPTPGYSEFHQSMSDIEQLSDGEFEYLISAAQLFNEYNPEYDPNLKAVNYPDGFEALLSQFDHQLPDDAWETMLNEIGLQQIKNYNYNKKDKFTAYHRKGSTSPGISAKVYFKTKRVMIFSASLAAFPNYHNRQEYPVWCLPPSFVLFYKNNRDWVKTVEEVKNISESLGLEFTPVLTTKYPLQVFPEIIRESILDVCKSRSLSPEFVATAALWTISSLAGTQYESEFNGEGKNILFCLMIAPVSVGKTPAYKVVCENPLKECHETMDKKYTDALEQWNKARVKAHADKKPFPDKRPSRFIPVSADGTTEGYIHKSMSQPNGIGVYQDEAETILNAGNFKATNDAISFFTQAFSGGRITQIRADETKERVVPNLNLNLLMGTQPARVKNIFTEDRLSSGFASRFLMVESGYNELNTAADPFGQKKEMCKEWVEIVTGLFYHGYDYNNGNSKVINIPITDDAKDVYRTYYRQLLTAANTRINSKAEEYIIGTEAKMSAYFPRLTQILAIIQDHTKPVITPDIVHDGWVLYRYYADSTIKIIAGICGEIETGLPSDLELLYQTLPEEFTRQEAAEICTRINLKERRFDISIRRKDFSPLFRKIGHGKYQKVK